MKVLGIAAFTPQGNAVADTLSEGFLDEYEIVRYERDLRDWCGQLFASGAAGMIFVGACGIAVRTIAPFLKSKTTDPAVLVADEAGAHVISLLSGHLGGANALAHKAAAILGAEPVITTATDVNGRFAVDVFAADNDLVIGSMHAAKKITASILWGEQVGFYSEQPFLGDLPQDLLPVEEPGAKSGGLSGLICVSETAPEKIFPAEAMPQTILHLIPRCLIVGIGCKKGKREEEIEIAVKHAFEKLSLPLGAMAGVASVDLKQDEPGILSFCENHALPFETFSPDVLMEAEGSVTSSPFVREVTGADNVCERAALCMAGDSGRLILEKQAGDGVTVAVAARDWSVSFEE